MNVKIVSKFKQEAPISISWSSSLIKIGYVTYDATVKCKNFMVAILCKKMEEKVIMDRYASRVSVLLGTTVFTKYIDMCFE